MVEHFLGIIRYNNNKRIFPRSFVMSIFFSSNLFLSCTYNLFFVALIQFPLFFRWAWRMVFYHLCHPQTTFLNNFFLKLNLFNSWIKNKILACPLPYFFSPPRKFLFHVWFQSLVSPVHWGSSVDWQEHTFPYCVQYHLSTGPKTLQSTASTSGYRPSYWGLAWGFHKRCEGEIPPRKFVTPRLSWGTLPCASEGAKEGRVLTVGANVNDDRHLRQCGWRAAANLI